MSNISIEERKQYIGASEVASLFGVGFKSRWEVWLEKTGKIDPEDLSANEYVQAGLFLEPAIAAWAADKWGMKLRKVKRYIKHPFLKGFGVSLDYESMEGTLIPVEIKYSQMRDGWTIEGDKLLDAPLKYLLQVQAQMACAGAHLAWLIVMLNGKMYRMLVERHPDTITRIEQEVSNFWLSVEQGNEPKPDFAFDGGTIAALMQVNKEKVVDMTTNNHLPVLCAEYQTAAANAKDAEARKDAAMAEIRTIIGDAGRVLANGYTITNSMVAEAQVSYVRKAYPLTRITAKKEK